MAARCFWDADTDNYTHDIFMNVSLFENPFFLSKHTGAFQMKLLNILRCEYSLVLEIYLRLRLDEVTVLFLLVLLNQKPSVLLIGKDRTQMCTDDITLYKF